MKRINYLIELSKLMVNMSERNATAEELCNVGEFFKAIIETELECDSIYEFELLNKYRIKYSK